MLKKVILFILVLGIYVSAITNASESNEHFGKSFNAEQVYLKVDSTERIFKLLSQKSLSNNELMEIESLVQSCDLKKALDDEENQLLHIACQNGHAKAVSILIDHGAIVDAVNIGYDTPLHVAASNGYSEIVQALILHGATINSQNLYRNTPLHLAAQNDQSHIVKILISHNAKIDIKGFDSKTPLHEAAEKGCTETVQILISLGANFNAEEYHCLTPLHLALVDGKMETANLLMSYGAKGINIVHKVLTYFENHDHNIIRPLEKNPHVFQNHPQKLFIACTLLAHRKKELIRHCFPLAQFTKEDAIKIITHLGHLCPNLKQSYCAKIIWLLPLLDVKFIKKIYTNLFLEKQKSHLAPILQINNICTALSKQTLWDVRFAFE